MLTHEFRFKGVPYDPREAGGPLQLNKLHLNSVHCTRGGMYITGLKSGGMLLFNGEKLQMSAQLPRGTHNARPFRDGVLFNDTEADALRYAGRGEGLEDRAFKVPRFDPEQLRSRDLDASGIARQGFARGLCTLSDTLVAGGSSPSTVSVYDLASNQRQLSVNLTWTSATPSTDSPCGHSTDGAPAGRLQSPALRTVSGSASTISPSSCCQVPRWFS